MLIYSHQSIILIFFRFVQAVTVAKVPEADVSKVE
jgi:hypothetical protein